MKNRILIIDDELEEIEAYKTALMKKNDQWEIEYFNNPLQALEAAKASPPDLVIADHLMPQMNGIEFLTEIRKECPSAERFILASHDDRELLDAGIGSSFHFLPKPCPPDVLVSEIQRTLAIESWLGNARTKEIVAKMGDFPSLPSMYLKVMNALNASDAGADKVGEAISSDLAITAKVMQVVNSSFFGMSEKVSDITQAVGILGVETVKNLVLAIQVYGKRGKTADQLALSDQLWHHSMSVAAVAKRIMQYETGDSKRAEEAYTAGLFHDVGKIIMLNAVPEEFEQARALAREKRIPLWEAEMETIGCTHCDTGAYLLGRWGLPVNIVEAAALHHEPINSFGSTFSHVTAIHVANALTWEKQPGDEAHPDAQADQRFLNEIGKAESWPEWQEVAEGKLTKKPASQKTSAAAKNEEDNSPTTESASEKDVSNSPIHAKQENAETPAASSRKNEGISKTTVLVSSLAACAALAIILALSSPSSETEQPEEHFATASSSEDLPLLEEEEITAEPTAHERLPDSIADTETTEEVSLPESEPVEPETLVKAETPLEPFPKPIVKAPPAFPAIQLTGIFYNPSSPAASINGRIRRVGDSVEGAIIESIEKKRITLSFAGESRSFKLQ